jgi:polar amino acid transport system substrate-binding protein
MKKIIKSLSVLLFVVAVAFLAGCGSQNLNFGKKLVKVGGMVDILVELDSKTSDVGVMDSIMAGYYINEEYKGKLMIIPDLELADEEYGIAARKDGAYTAKVISNAIIELYKEGKVLEIAKKYGLEQSIAIDENTKIDLSDETGKADYDEIVKSGKLVVGYTIFAPIAYEQDGKLIGFDTELAQAVGEKLGLEVVFQVINWDTKVFELESKAIDVIWNGMTITDKIKAETSVTIPYLKNKQVAVIRVEDQAKYKSTADMIEAIICVESGSAGQFCVEVEE